MALVSIETRAAGCFLRVNRSLCDITGLTEEDLVGTDFQAIVHPDDARSELHYVRWMLTGDIASTRSRSAFATPTATRCGLW